MRDDGIKAEENQPWSGKEGFMYSAQIHAAKVFINLNSFKYYYMITNSIFD